MTTTMMMMTVNHGTPPHSAMDAKDKREGYAISRAYMYVCMCECLWQWVVQKLWMDLYVSFQTDGKVRRS